MASNWESYYIVVLSAVMALAIPGVLSLVSWLLLRLQRGASNRNGGGDRPSLPEVQFPEQSIKGNADLKMGHRLNIRANRSINSAMLFILLSLFLIPYSATEVTPKSAVSIIVAVSFLLVALLYAVRKGDFNWTDSFVEKGPK